MLLWKELCDIQIWALVRKRRKERSEEEEAVFMVIILPELIETQNKITRKIKINA